MPWPMSVLSFSLCRPTLKLAMYLVTGWRKASASIRRSRDKYWSGPAADPAAAAASFPLSLPLFQPFFLPLFPTTIPLLMHYRALVSDERFHRARFHWQALHLAIHNRIMWRGFLLFQSFLFFFFFTPPPPTDYDWAIFSYLSLYHDH